jgi:hypothetical protein
MENTAQLPANTPTPWRDPPAVDRYQDRAATVITVRMKPALKARIDARCKQEEISLNLFCVQAITAMLDHLDALDATDAKLAQLPAIDESQLEPLPKLNLGKAGAVR